MNMKLTASKPGIIAVALLAGVWPLLVNLAAHSIFWNTNHAPGRMRECLELTGSCAVLAIGMLLLLGMWHEEACQAARFLCGLAERPIRALGSLFVRRRSIPSPSASARRARTASGEGSAQHPHSPMRIAFVEQDAPIKTSIMARNSMTPSPEQPACRFHPRPLCRSLPWRPPFSHPPPRGLHRVRHPGELHRKGLLPGAERGRDDPGRARRPRPRQPARRAGWLDHRSFGPARRRLSGVRLVFQVRRIHQDGNDCVMLNQACDREIGRDFN